MTFRELIEAERLRPAYLPPPSWKAQQAYIAALLKRLEQAGR